MMTHVTVYRMLLSSLFGIITLIGNYAFASDDVILYTPYTKISVPPGESISYSIDAINNTEEVQKIDIRIYGIPKSWDYTLKSGSYQVKQIAILPDEKKTLSLKVDVPLKVNKGNYYVNVKAADDISLPLVINVSKQGSFKSEFTSEQANMEGHAKSTFSFTGKIKNSTGEKQLYSLRSKAPRGWRVTFKANYKQATSVEVQPNNSEDVTIDIVPPHTVVAGTYKIPVTASTINTSAELELEVVITGTYELELTTSRGLLSAKVTAGDEKNIDLLIKNTGSSDLINVELSASKPSGWDVEFDPKQVEKIEAGKSATVSATIKADKKAIAGDYVTNLTAKTPEASSQAAFRISVRTPMIWGWIGILVILASVGTVFQLIRKFGRR